ncbi:Transcription factor GTE7 [Camellia lanceoleosa]|uniref:Transcription factor GTE7 n=1 Tax=Camellia lanceoleosa TaxID=1840588 RepID=A0ACC0IY68_9ERIC|nr:Transcription factor GTE7 [Camellia lanceoleosa]
MASAVLASRNEPYWGERKVYMRKYTNSSNNKPRFNNFNPDPINTSPNRLPNRQIHDSSSTKTHAWHNDQPPLRPAPPDDSSELNRKPNEPNAHGESSHGGYLTFNLAAYSKAELKELKRRLRSELEQVRGLRARIDNHRGRDDYRSGYHGGGRDAASVVPRPPPLQLDSAMASPAAAASGSKEKRTPKANQFQPPADFATGKNKKMFNPAYKKFEAEHQRVVAAEQVNQRIWAPAQEPVIMEENVRRSLPQPAAMLKKSDSMRVQETLPSPLAVEEVEAVVAPVSIPAAAAKPVVMPRSTQKLPKPKARDPNKRQMSFEEKARLGLNLQNLPLEKMDQMLEIIKKRNSHMAQEGDEIELDIEALDNETLWELDRFVSNHKKAESKMKRQGLMNNVVLTAPIAAPINKSPVREPTPEAVGGQKSRKGDAGEEDVDIGEEIPINNFPPVEIEKDVANGSSRSSSSSSSSSSSDSSSSSGSDSGSSSGSDSDEDSVQSPFVESKEAS